MKLAINDIDRILFLTLFRLDSYIDVFLLNPTDLYLLHGDGQDNTENEHKFLRWISYFTAQVNLGKIKVYHYLLKCYL